MNNFFKTIINKIPPLPESILQIEALAKDPNITYKSVAKILNKDPLLTSEVLRAANAPIYGFSREINTLENAISLFGIGTIRGFVLATYVKENFDFTLKPYSMSSTQFSSTSIKQHALVTNWFLKTEPKLLHVLSPAAFLLGLGQVLITQYLLETKNVDAFKEALLLDRSIQSVEEEFSDITATKLSAEIFDYWYLENALVCSLRYIDEPFNAPQRDIKTAQILQCVQTAVTYNGNITDKSISEALILIKEYKLDEESFLKALETVK